MRDPFGGDYPPGCTSVPGDEEEATDLSPILARWGYDDVRAWLTEDGKIVLPASQEEEGEGEGETLEFVWRDELTEAQNLTSAASVVRKHITVDRRKLARLNAILRAGENRQTHHLRHGKVPTFKSWMADLNFPEGDFEWEGEFGDWSPYYCGEHWHNTAQMETFRRKGGKLEVEVWTCDEDGDRDCVDSYTEGEPADRWREVYRYHLGEATLDAHFLGWADYHLSCAVDGGDPLDDFFNRCASRADHLKAAADYLKPIARDLRREARARKAKKAKR